MVPLMEPEQAVEPHQKGKVAVRVLLVEVLHRPEGVIGLRQLPLIEA